MVNYALTVCQGGSYYTAYFEEEGEMMEFIIVGAGGFFGSCLRYGLTRITNTVAGAFPLGTLLSNVIAGILIGFIIGLEEHTDMIAPRIKLFITTGLLGGLSTFSTFSLESVALFKTGKYMLAFGNIFLNLGLSLVGVVLGMLAAKMLLKRA